MAEPRLILITKEAAYARGFDMVYLHQDYGHRKARRLYLEHPAASMVYIGDARWGTPGTRYRPSPGELIYVKYRGQVYLGAGLE